MSVSYDLPALGALTLQQQPLEVADNLGEVTPRQIEVHEVRGHPGSHVITGLKIHDIMGWTS